MPDVTPDQPNLLAPPPAEAQAQVKPQQDLWKLRDLLLLIIFLPVDWFVSSILALSGYAVLKPVMHWQTSIGGLKGNEVFGLVLECIIYIFLLAYLYLLVKVHYRKPFWNALHWRKIGLGRATRYLLGGVALSMAVMLISTILPEKKSFPLEKMFSSTANAYAIAFFAITVAPFMEELLFRGVLFAFFQKNAGLRFAIFGTAVLFAGLHVQEYWGAWDRIVLILVVGLVLSSVRGLTDSLTPSVILHAAYNATLMAVFFLQSDHFRKLPEMIFR